MYTHTSKCKNDKTKKIFLKEETVLCAYKAERGKKKDK
jgi:hypothetical protein